MRQRPPNQNDSNDKQSESGIPALGIPGEMSFNPEIPPAAQLLFGLIRNLSKGPKGCWSSNRQLGIVINKDNSSVKRFLSKLRDGGYIVIEHSKNKKNGSLERHIFESTAYRELYRPLAEVVSQYLAKPGSILPKEYKKRVRQALQEIKSAKRQRGEGLKTTPGGEGGGSKMSRGGLKNEPLSNSILNSIIEDTKVSLSDSGESPGKPLKRFQRLSPKEAPPDYIKPKTGEWAVLASWSKLPRPAGQHAKLNTQTIKRAVESITQLKNGVFGNPARRQFDTKLLNKHKIELTELAPRKFPIREICRVIEGPFADMFKEGYWPPNKEGLPKRLSDFFYNPRTQWSFFLQCVYAPPGLLKNPLTTDPHPNLTKYLVQHGFTDLKDPSPSLWKSYLEGIAQLKKYLNDINWGNYGSRQMFPGGEKGELYGLVTAYVKWLKGRDYPELLAAPHIERLEWSMLRPDFWMWQKFQESVNRYWGRVFKCIPTEED